MYKVTPNPPGTSGIESIDPQAADRALAYYILPQGGGPKRPDIAGTPGEPTGPQSREEALVSASSILDSAAATAYENADNLTGANRKVAMGVVHLIELAQRQVNSVIEEQPAGATS
ncbi:MULTISPECIES: hypothetical protein [Pseudomonas]|uniref:DUF6124 family protein n=1 Tax=Pseudomonas TaxID=286 RepID=UPI000CD55640|nr:MULTISPECIES: hypothetical protein [Pseudomonas]MBV6754255.1 hypothetical protein [Pseudomonas chlororaphis]RBH56839.1 hypothetical protein C3F00_012485 [Pseudomonas sp. MWU13-2860]